MAHWAPSATLFHYFKDTEDCVQGPQSYSSTFHDDLYYSTEDGVQKTDGSSLNICKLRMGAQSSLPTLDEDIKDSEDGV